LTLHLGVRIISELGELGRLIEIICNDILGVRPIPRYVKDEAKRVLIAVSNRYITQGRRLEAFVIASLGIARGDKTPAQLKDLAYRAEYILGERIPKGQIDNTFNELLTFWKFRHLYEWRRYHESARLTSEERRLLLFLRSEERFPAR